MCGIAGIINPKEKDVITKMTDAILHRGPDDAGFFSDEHVSLGMRRLSIIDLARGKQPISSTDDRYLIFFNGEIYNYLEIKKELGDYVFKTESDTEVILAGFQKWGEGVLPRLRGMFTFCIYDTVEKKLFLARDPFGIKPLYYWMESNSIKAFSSEIKSFLQIPGFKPEVNDAAVYNYLSYQYNPLSETFFKNVFKLPPAHSLTLDLNSGQHEIRRYWQFAFKPDESLEEEGTKSNILKTMEDSVAHHMIADVPIGSFLSGGIDSSIIATLMSRGLPSGQKVKTFTVAFDGVSEGVEAKETAEPLGTDHHEITIGAKEYFESLSKAIWHFDEPVADPSALGLYFLAREARKSVKVVLSGEGADELFGGYNIYLAPFASGKLSWIPKSLIGMLLKLPFNFFGKNYLGRVYASVSDWYIGNASVFNKKEVEKLWPGNMSRLRLDNLYSETQNWSESTKMQYIDIHTWLVGDILAKADKMTMAHSLELRVPFLDNSVASLASKLPDSFKWRNGQTKYLLREAFKKVLPESTRKRKKLGFPTPVRDWFTTERIDLYDTILENSYIQSHMDVTYIKKMIDEHTSKARDHSRKIYLLLIFAIWYNVFIEHGHP